MMRILILLVWASSLAAAASDEEEPGSCLLQKRNSDLQQVAHVQERRQEPESDDDEQTSGSDANQKDATSDLGADAPKKDSGDPSEDKNTSVKKNGEEEGDFDKKIKKEKEKFDKKSEKEQGEGNNDDENGERDKDASMESLRLELWLPVSMKDLKGDKGDLSLYLDTLKTELATAGNISTDRLDMLGVRGDYEDEGASGKEEEKKEGASNSSEERKADKDKDQEEESKPASFFSKDIKASLQDGPVVALEESAESQSIIDIEVLPSANASDPSPQKALTKIREQLGDDGSPLMKGPLKKTLSGAKLVMGAGVSGLLPNSGATHQESRLAPLVVAAVTLLAAWAGLHDAATSAPML